MRRFRTARPFNSSDAVVRIMIDVSDYLAQAADFLSKFCSVIGDALSYLAVPKRAGVAIWSFRASSEHSRAKMDDNGNTVAGDASWSIGTGFAIAQHFAEFHADEGNRKDTAMISATPDIIRALKKMHGERKSGIDATKVYLTVFYAASFYRAKELLDMARRPPVYHQLSKDARDRMDSDKHKHLHDSEIIFLHHVPAEDARFHVSLQELLERGLAKVLPEMFGNDNQTSLSYPKLIRRSMSASRNTAGEVASRYAQLFMVIVGDCGGKKAEAEQTIVSEGSGS